MNSGDSSKRSPTILVADDDPAVRTYFTRTLEKEGYKVVAQGSSGPDTVKRATETKPDLLLLDIHLPGFTGLEALRRIREHHPVVTVLVTSDRDPNLIDQVSEDAVFAYLIKPVESVQLLSSVRFAWKTAQTIRDLRDENNSLQEKVALTRLLSKAKTVLQKRLRVSEEEAHRVLQKVAMNTRRSMAQVAKSVLEGEIPSPTDG
jgi:AmiR/NasT family two-component response regulator